MRPLQSRICTAQDKPYIRGISSVRLLGKEQGFRSDIPEKQRTGSLLIELWDVDGKPISFLIAEDSEADFKISIDTVAKNFKPRKKR